MAVSLVWPVLAKIVGLALTAIAISLGAPFWFDLLSMFMRIRGTGDKPEKTSQHSGDAFGGRLASTAMIAN